jgi:hypothetical protein
VFSILCQPQPPHRLIQIDQNVILDFQQVAYIKSVKRYCCAQMGFKAILLSACNIPNAHRNHSWHSIVWTACSVCTHDIMHNYSDCHWHWMDPWHNSLEWLEVSLFRFTPFWWQFTPFRSEPGREQLNHTFVPSISQNALKHVVALDILPALLQRYMFCWFRMFFCLESKRRKYTITRSEWSVLSCYC